MSDLAKEIMKLGEKRGLEKGREEGLEEGHKEGAEQCAREIALALLKRGIVAPEQIAEVTGLPLETVLSLKD